MKSMISIYGIMIIIIGIIGVILNRKNIILMLISIELILFACCIILIVEAVDKNTIVPIGITFYVLVLAGSELSIGLSIVIRLYKTKGATLEWESHVN